jgi:signal transduction histidine kinase/ligand-binding sensor domain-containing protein/DNA-binding response OmpR family regulator
MFVQQLHKLYVFLPSRGLDMKIHLYFFLVFTLVAKSGYSLQFDHLTIEDGLSSNYVNCIFQDSSGFMWFGTDRGLNRWDGVEVRLFEHVLGDYKSLCGNDIRTIIEDEKHVMWIGTASGLNRYDRKTETFRRYGFLFKDRQGHNLVNTILADGDSLLWLGTDFGLLRFHKALGTYERFWYTNDNAVPVISQYHIYNLNWLNDGKIIIGTADGFIKFDPKTATFSQVHSRLGEEQWSAGLWTYIDKDDRVWMGLRDQGVFCYNQLDGELKNYTYSKDTTNKNFSEICCIVQDQNDKLWFASLGGGLFCLDETNSKFIQYLPKMGDNASISSANTCFLHRDRQGNLWIGTSGGGVNKITRWSKSFRFHYLSAIKETNWGGRISALCEDREGVLWVARSNGDMSWIQPDFTTVTRVNWGKSDRLYPIGFQTIEKDRVGNIWLAPPICKYDWSKKSVTFMSQPPFDRDQVNRSYVRTVSQDSLGNMWFGTSDGALIKMTESGKTTVYRHHAGDSTSLKSNFIIDLMCDKFGTLWIISRSRLSCCLAGEERFQNYFFSQKGSLRSVDGINALFEDKQGQLWVCAYGLYKINRKTNRLENDATFSNGNYGHVRAIVEDHNGNLWLRTVRGLVRYNPETGATKIYDPNDGFSGILDYGGSSNSNLICGASGHIYYSSSNMLCRFHPDSLFENPNAPSVVLTDLKVNYQMIFPGQEEWFPKALEHLKKIEIPWSVKAFSIGFAALDYTSAKNNKYGYKLEGFHNDWIYCGNEKQATITNLPPGNYVFRVKAGISYTVWNEEGTSIKIHILPPWWRTTWAWMLWIGLFGAAVYGAYCLQLNRSRLRQQVRLEHDHAERLAQLDRMKSNFFANISHEFRTPLTLILGPLEDINQKSKSVWLKKQCQLMLSNGRRLLVLINQLLDFSALEAGGLKLRVSEVDIVAFVKRIVASFMSLAERKKIALFFVSNERIIPAYFDSEQFEKVIVNLLSNAFKFTSNNGSINVAVNRVGLQKEEVDVVEIIVKDSGVGIPKDQLDNIFNRFYQVNNVKDSHNAGTGIGLALSKELVELHGGSIQAECKEGDGSRFIVRLPLGRAFFADSDLANDTINESFFQPIDEDEADVEMDDVLDDHRKPCVLIVEDNKDVRQYVRDILTPDFHTREAIDGEQGFVRAVERIPDLILSDVMMPVVDGFELSKRLKSDDRTSHIPIILLTARASDGSKIEGLELGIDDYIIKPFNAHELKVRVKNLIIQRKKLREKFSRTWASASSVELVAPIDERFLQRALELVEANIDDPEFNAEVFAHKIGLSRMQLHRKLKSLTDMTTSQFVAAVRLKRAAEMLKSRTDSVSQIAFQVGFNNPSYFAECFKKMYAMTPSKYAADSML